MLDGKSIVQYYISVMINNLCIELGLDVYALICYSCIGCIKFNSVNTLCYTAQGQSLLNICIYLTVYDSSCFKCGKSKIKKIIKTKLRSNLSQRFNGYDI